MRAQGQAPLQGRRILVVEDEYLTAGTVAGMLEMAGAQVLGPIGFLAEALQFVQRSHPMIDLAVLDVNLHGEKSYPVAEALAAHRIGFVFATGYGASGLEERYQRFKRCEKPFNPAVLLDALSGELRAHRV